jgi:putative addiction module component (TIGR02574 family)
MSEAAEAWKQQLALLSTEDRAELAQYLLQSLDEAADRSESSDRMEEPPPDELDADLRQELDRRLAAHDAHPHDVLTWEEVKTYARGRR